MHAFNLSNLANRQTERQTNTGKKFTSSFVGGKNKVVYITVVDILLVLSIDLYWKLCSNTVNWFIGRRQVRPLHEQKNKSVAGLLLFSVSLYFSKRGAYWDRLCRDVVGCWLSRACKLLWPLVIIIIIKQENNEWRIVKVQRRGNTFRLMNVVTLR